MYSVHCTTKRSTETRHVFRTGVHVGRFFGTKKSHVAAVHQHPHSDAPAQGAASQSRIHRNAFIQVWGKTLFPLCFQSAHLAPPAPGRILRCHLRPRGDSRRMLPSRQPAALSPPPEASGEPQQAVTQSHWECFTFGSHRSPQRHRR